MTLGTILSRGTGVIRLAALAVAFGIAETRLTDTYILANTVPNIIYELVLGGVVTSIFVPLFVELLEKESRDEAWRVISAIINLCLIALSVIALVGVVVAPLIASFYATRLEGAEAELQQQTITFLLRLFMPQVVLYGIYFVTAGILNAHKRFGPPMWTPIVNNLVLIAIFLIFRANYGEVSLRTLTSTQLLLIGLGTTASVAPMGLLLLPYLRGLGRYELTVSLQHPAIRKIGRLAGYVIGLVAANQVAFVVIQWLANQQQGAYSAYVAAWTFFLMPVGLFVWSITTALVPSMSEHAVHERWDDYRDRLTLGVRALMFLMIPASLGYLVLGRPLVELLLEHGMATSRSTELVSDVLTMFVLGLVQFSIFQLFVRAWYATQDARTPFVINCVVVVVNIAISALLFVRFGVQGIAAGQAVAYTVGVVLNARALAAKGRGVDVRSLAGSFTRIALASVGMAAVVAALYALTQRAVGSDAVVAQVLVMAVLVAAGAATFLALSLVLRVQELAYVRSLLVRRGAPAGAA